MPLEIIGWILGMYPDERDGAVIWLLGEDGRRRRLTRPFPTTFYLGGEPCHLQAARAFLERSGAHLQPGYTTRRDLYKGELRVLEITADNPVTQQRLVASLRRNFNRLRFYDANIPFSIRGCIAWEVFPTARCRLQVDGAGCIESILALDDPWEVEYSPLPVRTLRIEPDGDPAYGEPRRLLLQTGEQTGEVSLRDKAQALRQIDDLLRQYDPDLILASHGDGWLFPGLLAWAQEAGLGFNPNRDPRQAVLVKKELTFQSYGSIHYRAAQAHLFGRWHIDPLNAGMTGGFSLQAAVEMARITGLDVQVAARNSPGAGFTAMQMREALRRGVLVPSEKRQTERLKTAMQLNLADAGGLNYCPLVGLHRHVAELDYFSMYPSIMQAWNISGETVGQRGQAELHIPQSGVPISQDTPGLVAAILRPLLAKRLEVKRRLANTRRDDPLYASYKATADALKWIGYVSFGYQGFKNNLFGNIQAHEAITSIGREMLVRAKEAAHDLGFKVLGANTDSLFVQKRGATAPQDFQALIEEIRLRTGLVIELEGIYDWLVFLPAKGNPHVGVSNRYFGKFQNGELKVRGLAQRRSDTPAWVAQAEKEILEMLAAELDAEHVPACVAKAIAITRRYLDDLRREAVPLEDLVAARKLTRQPEQYSGASQPAQVARQRQEAGQQAHVGQHLEFLYTHGGRSKARAWGLPVQASYKDVDKRTYTELLLRAVHELLLCFGLSAAEVASLVQGDARQLSFWQAEGIRNELIAIPLETPSLAEALFAPYLYPPEE